MATSKLSDGDNFRVLGTGGNARVVEEIKDIFTMTKQERFAKLAQELKEEFGIEVESGTADAHLRVVK
ncbi:hypothetical protein [Shimia sp. MIT910701]|uniref:hypothetical protein n=1 Tax=Shimia sp. MIT910701 TaxID=3096987 RepID=UPI0039998E42